MGIIKTSRTDKMDIFSIFHINEACSVQHINMFAKGFKPQPIASELMLIVSELSEALEADRTKRHANMLEFENAMNSPIFDEKYADENEKFKVLFEICVKNTLEDEIADTFLRLMDFCGEHEIDIERHIQLKARYNLLRPFKHGKEY